MLRNIWPAALRMAAAFALTASTRAAAVRKDEDPAALYAVAVRNYEEARPSVFVDYVRGYDSFGDLARDADAVATGHVDAAATAPLNLRGPAFDTSYAFDVGRVFAFKPAGGIGDRIVIRQPGGSDADGIRRIAADDPPFEAGVTYLVFLRRGPDGRYGVLGGAAGRLLVVEGRASALSVVYRDDRIVDTGAAGVSVDLLMAWLGLAGAGVGPQAVLPARAWPFVPTRQGDEKG